MLTSSCDVESNCLGGSSDSNCVVRARSSAPWAAARPHRGQSAGTDRANGQGSGDLGRASSGSVVVACSQTRWQAARRPARPLGAGGRHHAAAAPRRAGSGVKGSPAAGLLGLGTSPRSGVSWVRRRRGSMAGAAASRLCVYGCSGREQFGRRRRLDDVGPRVHHGHAVAQVLPPTGRARRTGKASFRRCCSATSRLSTCDWIDMSRADSGRRAPPPAAAAPARARCRCAGAGRPENSCGKRARCCAPSPTRNHQLGDAPRALRATGQAVDVERQVQGSRSRGAAG